MFFFSALMIFGTRSASDWACAPVRRWPGGRMLSWSPATPTSALGSDDAVSVEVDVDAPVKPEYVAWVVAVTVLGDSAWGDVTPPPEAATAGAAAGTAASASATAAANRTAEWRLIAARSSRACCRRS